MEFFYKEAPPKMLLEYGFEFFSTTVESFEIYTKAHIHPAIEMLYIIGGSFEIGIDRQLKHASEGDIVLFRSNVIHTIKRASKEETGMYYVLKISPDLLFRIYSGGSGTSQFINFLRRSENDISVIEAKNIPTAVKELWERMIDEYEHTDDLSYSVQRSYASVMLSLLLRSALAQNTASESVDGISEKNVLTVYDSISYINKNYALPITAEACAAYVHLSYSYFAKLFKNVVGKSFKEYLIGIRLSRAYNSIISGSSSITEIAFASGYSNLSHFIAEFKKMYGKSPNEIRKKQNIILS